MKVDFTNNYTILKDILKNEYTLVLTLLMTNISDIIQLLKQRMPLQGEILEYLYLSMPTYYNHIHAQICSNYRYVDNVIRTLYKNHRKELCYQIKVDIKNICSEFHIEDDEFGYYYFVALLIIALESSINEDAFTLYSQFNSDIKENIDNFLQELISIFNKDEFQCLFYNHLEDVYQTNLSIDKSFSVIHENNYSYFLDNININNIFTSYLKPIPNKRYPIIISNEYIYNIIDKRPCMLEKNYIKNKIFHPSIIYCASYYIQDKTIRNWIPVFNYFYKYKDEITIDIYDAFYNNYVIQYPLNDDSMIALTNSEPYYLYTYNDENNLIKNIHYYIDIFSVYSNSVFEAVQQDNNNN